MKLADIKPNPSQPRKDFDEEKLKELSENIKQVGLKQPLIVRPLSTGGKFQLVDGERRYRACKLIPLEDVPVDIREDIKTDQDAAIQSYIMNEQRLNYNPQDKEAYIYHLKETTKLSTRKLADKLGVHHSHIDHLLEAYRFRQELPPTEVGILNLSHTNLRETSMIKDKKLRIRFLQLITDNKIKASGVREAYRLLGKIPAERKEVFEAYALGMLTSVQIQSLLEGPPMGREILIKPEEPTSRMFVKQIPSEDVKERIYFAVGRSFEERCKKNTLKALKEEFDKQIAEAGSDEKKREKIRHDYEVKVKESVDMIHRYSEHHSMDVLEKEFQSDEKVWTAIRWWLSVFYDHKEKLDSMEDRDLAFAVIDLVTEVARWEALQRGMKHDEVVRRLVDAGVGG
jgi:ParB/RepB/Spo0J family partition protein